MVESSFQCKYCKKPLSKVEYELSDGYCLQCKDIQDWKHILKERKKTDSPSK